MERLYMDSNNVKCNIRDMIRREPEWVASRFDFMMDRIAELEAELAVMSERLTALVDKLPRTVDGVPVVPGVDVVWQIDPRGWTNAAPGLVGPDPNPKPWHCVLGGHNYVSDFPFYSTREAANPYEKYRNANPRCTYPFRAEPLGYCCGWAMHVDGGTKPDCETCEFWRPGDG